MYRYLGCSQMPSSVAHKYMSGNGHEVAFEHLDGDQLTYFNVLGGACLSMALNLHLPII